jgi:hypothetical protein
MGAELMTPVYGESLDDPRVSIEDGDVNKVIRGARYCSLWTMARGLLSREGAL